MSEKRIFETDDKFWEVWIDGSQVFTHFGKTGASGQTKIKPTADEAAAEAAMSDMIKKKKKEGYEQSGGPKGDAGPKLDAKELKKHLGALTSATDPAVLVLADWLQTQNHPWGELIALQYNAATTPKKAATLEKAADKLLADKRDEIRGDLADATEITVWKSGFAQTATLGSPAESKAIVSALKKFLAHPLGKVVEKIVLAPIQPSFTPWQDWDDSEAHVVDPWDGLDAVASAIPARVTELGFGAWPSAAAAAYTNLPSFTKLSKTFPKLTKLDLNGTGVAKPGKLSLPALTDLRIHFSMATDADLLGLAGSKLPKLERLTIGLGGSTHATVDEVYGARETEYDDDDEPIDDDQSRYPTFSAGSMESMTGYGDVSASRVGESLATLLATPFPALTDLSFESTYLSDDIVGALVKSKLCKQVKTLDLSNSRFAEDALKTFLGAKKQLAHLESIDLRKCGLDDKAQKKVKAALPNAKLDKGKAKGPAFYFRYLATME